MKLLPAPRSRFPQYPRLFSASIFAASQHAMVKTIYWALFVGLLAINTYAIGQRIPRSAFSYLKTKVSISPQLSVAIDRLSSVFSTRTTHTSVLGEAQEHPDPSFESLTRAHSYWQNIVGSHPDYRDGYFNLAIIAYRMNNFPDARMYVKKVKELDPNYIPVLELEKNINLAKPTK